MKKRIRKLSISLGIAGLLLVGCTNEVAPKEETLHTDGVNFNELYQLKDSDVLVEISGKELTVGEAKERAFQQALVIVINEFVDRELLLNEFKVSDKEVEQAIQEQKDALGELGEQTTFNKAEIAYNLSYQKALEKLVTYTDEDLSKIYNEYYKDSGRTFDDMEGEIKQQALFILGNKKLYDFQQELRKKSDVTYFDDTLKQFLDVKEK